jgi:hypothetical protein
MQAADDHHGTVQLILVERVSGEAELVDILRIVLLLSWCLMLHRTRELRH